MNDQKAETKYYLKIHKVSFEKSVHKCIYVISNNIVLVQYLIYAE